MTKRWAPGCRCRCNPSDADRLTCEGTGYYMDVPAGTMVGSEFLLTLNWYRSQAPGASGRRFITNADVMTCNCSVFNGDYLCPVTAIGTDGLPDSTGNQFEFEECDWGTSPAGGKDERVDVSIAIVCGVSAIRISITIDHSWWLPTITNPQHSALYRLDATAIDLTSPVAIPLQTFSGDATNVPYANRCVDWPAPSGQYPNYNRGTHGEQGFSPAMLSIL